MLIVTPKEHAQRHLEVMAGLASMVSNQALGSKDDEIRALGERFASALRSGTSELAPEFGDLRALVGVRQFPNRVRCALLAFEAIEDALAPDEGSDAPG